jgi:hypothetical protein
MTLNMLSQVGITLFGGAAIWLVGRPDPRTRRWGFVCGLLSQPWWYTQMVLHGQWPMLPVYTWYTFSWLSGLRANWRMR